MEKIKALIVEDEHPAQRRLIQLLSAQPDVLIQDVCGNSQEASAAVARERPDLIFLDINLPGMNGVQFAKSLRIEPPPELVFVTAFDQYALEAFRLAALDYLQKPFDDQRFEETLKRVRERLGKPNAYHQTILEIERKLASLEKALSPRYLTRLAITDRGTTNIVPVDWIHYVEADRVYIDIHTDKGSFLMRQKIGELARSLDPKHFCRIHRSTIVNLRQITSVQPNAFGSLEIVLQCGKKLKVSRNFRKELTESLGVSL